MAAELTAKKNLTVRMLSQNTQSAAVAARYRRTCVWIIRGESEMPHDVMRPV